MTEEKIYNLPQLEDLPTRARIGLDNRSYFYGYNLRLEQEKLVKSGYLWWKKEKLKWMLLQTTRFIPDMRDDDESIDDYAKSLIATLYSDAKGRCETRDEFDSFLATEPEFFDPEAWLAERSAEWSAREEKDLTD